MRIRPAGRQLGVAALAILFVAGVWAVIVGAAALEASATRARAVADAGALARATGDALDARLQALGGSLQALAELWRNDPAGFDPATSVARALLMPATGAQAVLLGADGRVVAATHQQLRSLDLHGLGATSGSDITFVRDPAALPAPGTALAVARRLVAPDGTLGGLLVVLLDTTRLVPPPADDGTICLIGPDGALHPLAGPGPGGPAKPPAALLDTARSVGDGAWIGPAAAGAGDRLYAARRLAGGLQLLVGRDMAGVVQGYLGWQRAAVLLGAVVTLLATGLAALAWRFLGEPARWQALSAESRARLAASEAAADDARRRADRRRAELRTALDMISDGVAVHDGELRLTAWNAQFSDCTGVPAEILRVGLPLADILRAQARAGEFGLVDVEAEVERRLALLRARQPITRVERTRPDGRVLGLWRVSLPDGGFVTVYRDVTQESGDAGASPARFAAIVSHEIRTPLQAVLSALALLADSGLPAPQRHLAERAQRSGEALAQLVNDILEMSRMEAGRLILRPTLFALRPLLEGVVDMFLAPAEERGIVLQLALAPDVPETLRTDPGRLQQVLINLLGNAVKYTRPGTVTLHAWTAVEEGAAVLCLAVRDQGPQIGAEDAQRLFQPFVRLETAGAAQPGGTGLGLAICRRLAELMGGRIGLATAGPGNEFWLALPIAVASAARPSGPAVQRRPPRTRILLVEDVTANQIVTATQLRREGHHADIARTGLEALEMLQRKPYDLVLMDLFMPGIDGLETARRVRRQTGPNQATPILALTANVSLEDRGACLEAGMQDMLAKPVRVAQLQEALLRFVWPVHAEAARAAVPRVAMQGGPRLDLGHIADLRNSLPAATFPSMIENCLSDLQHLMPELRRALEDGALAAAAEAAHAMTGVSSGYGLIALRRRTGMVVQAARAGNAAAAVQAAKGLEAELERTAAELRAFVQLQAA